jgi:hypothetical protein
LLLTLLQVPTLYVALSVALMLTPLGPLPLSPLSRLSPHRQGFWLLGVLLGYFLTFHHGMGVRGLWIGIASGDTATAVLNSVTLLTINWTREAQRVRDRIQHEEEERQLKLQLRQQQQLDGEDDYQKQEQQQLLMEMVESGAAAGAESSGPSCKNRRASIAPTQ